MGVPQNGRFIMENPIRMDDLEIPFQETSKWFQSHIFLMRKADVDW